MDMQIRSAKDAVTEKQPLVTERLGRAKQEVDYLRGVIDKLVERLHPVLSDEKGSGSVGSPKPDYSVPLAAEIDDLGDSVAGAARTIEFLLRNIEI